MEIIENSSIFDHKYHVQRSFFASPAGENTRLCKAGERITFDAKTPVADVIGYCRLKKIRPEIPPIAQYRVLRGFRVRLTGQGVEDVKSGEFVEMTADDAWSLLLKGWIEPLDQSVWSLRRLSPILPKSRQQIKADVERLNSITAGGKARIGHDWKVHK